MIARASIPVGSESTRATGAARRGWRRWHGWRSTPWWGGLFIAVIVALAAFDIWRGYAATLTNTGRELDALSRVIAEQTARSVQTVDHVTRHIAEAYRSGKLDTGADEAVLHAYLRDQAIGLVQVTGLSIIGADGRVRASSSAYPLPVTGRSVAQVPAFQQLKKAGAEPGLVVAQAMRGVTRPETWIFPLGRRLETADGRFAGAIAAGGRVQYFQDFYRDLRLESDTMITLAHRDGTLIARHPVADPTLLGRRFERLDRNLAAAGDAQAQARTRVDLAAPGTSSAAAGGPPTALRQGPLEHPTRYRSPIDGVERFGMLRLVADYPLAVMVSRDASLVLAPWRAEATGTALRTLALGVLAMALLVLVRRQFNRLEGARASLEESRERFALAAAGSDEGIWDWDLAGDRMYASARTREIFGLAPGPDVQPRDEWFASLRVHPDDAAGRFETLHAHLEGRTPVYRDEYRVRRIDGQYAWVRLRGLCVRDARGRPQRMAGSVTDIDARRRAEDALRLSEERLALAMIGSTGGHWVWEPPSDTLFVSTTLNQVFGLPAQPQVTTKDQFFSHVRLHAEDEPRIEQMQRDVDDPGVARLDYEYRIVLPGSAEVRWILTRAQCFRDATGRAQRVAGVSVDISARKRTEEALRLSEERFALAVAGSNDGIIDWDIALDRLFASARAWRLIGLPPEDGVLTRAQWAPLVMPRFHPADRVRVLDELNGNGLKPAEAHEGEYLILGADGDYHWMRFRGRLTRDAAGRPARWAGSVSDIDALKKTELALRRSQERYQLAVDGSNEGLWDWDLASDSLFLSARAQDLVGLPAGEVQRPRRDWLRLAVLHPDDHASVREALAAHLRGQSRRFKAEFRLRQPEGEWRWYRQRGVAVRDAGGRPLRMAGSLEDITDRKRDEAERERLEAQLRQAQKLEAIGTLAGGIAHDFNNILAAILGYGEMAQKGAAQGSAQRRHIDAALSAGLRAKSLVERILAFSRAGMGARVPVHVESVVAEALDAVAASLPAGVRLERRLETGDAAVLGDPTQVHQVVMNLCANAVQAMRTNGTLKVALDLAQRLESPCCATRTLCEGSYVRLSVADSGSGIPEHLLERIFDPFFTTKEVGVGTGLGLSLVHGIVTDLGGGIDVESAVGAGTTFTVYLPWQANAASAQSAAREMPRGHGQTVLLVDDEEPLVRLGEEVLAGLGYEPVGFTSSVAALQSLRAMPARFDLVLSDEAMPEMTGSELARAIRAIRADIPIVLMSGYVTPALTRKARDAGVADVLAKPLVAHDIASSLAQALRALQDQA